MPHIAHFALVVRNYDEAIAYYTQMLGFELADDTPLGDGKRWVLIAPPGARETHILLVKAASEEQASHIGNQTGGRVFVFLHTDDFRRDYDALKTRGVKFIEAPRVEPYGDVAVFEDLYGNRWDLVQPRR